MKRKELTPFEQSLRDQTWEHIYRWHSEHPLYICSCGTAYGLLTMVAAIIRYGNIDTPALLVSFWVLLMGTGVLLFALLKYFVKRIYCRNTWIQARAHCK